jgi:hypothetical protein
MKKIDDDEDLAQEDLGLGPDSAGQSGDLQGLNSEEVTELLEEGNSFEAGIINGIENAPNADEGPIKTREVLEDDVPLEYDKDSLDSPSGG